MSYHQTEYSASRQIDHGWPLQVRLKNTRNKVNNIEIEKQMMGCDYKFCLQVGDKNPVLSFLLLPYMSLIGLEMSQYFDIKVDNIHLKNIRAKAKFLDDTKIDIPSTIRLINMIWINHLDYFYTPHGDSDSKRAMQQDLGEFRYRGHFIGTTYLFTFYLSLSSRNTTLRELESGKSKEIGIHLGRILHELSSHININAEIDQIPFLKTDDIQHTDEKSDEYFQNLFYGELDPNLGQLIQIYLSNLNFVHFVLDSRKINTYTLFKIRYITIFHVISSIKKLQSHFRKNNILTNNSDMVFRIISSDDVAKKVLSNKQFRNVLVHYKLGGENILFDHSDPLFGLVELFFKNESTESLSLAMNIKIDSTIRILNQSMTSSLSDFECI